MDFKNNNEIKSYINDICDQVKNKRVHKEIIAELNAHLEEKANEYLKGGKSETEAIKEAIKEMGSSKHVGDELNEIHKCNPEWSIIVISITLVLLSIGVMTFFNIDAYFMKVYRTGYAFNKMILLNMIGVITLLIACFIDYRKIKKYSKYIYAVATFILIFTDTLAFGTRGGSPQELDLGWDLSINMAYFGPAIFIISLAGMYDQYDWDNRDNIIKGLLIGIIPLLLLVNSTQALVCFVVYGLSLDVLVYMSKSKKKILGLFVSIEFLILYLAKIGFECAFGFINRWNDINDSGYIYNQLKIMRESSSLIGSGMIFDQYKLPGFNNDFIFSYIVYSFGWVVGVIVVILISTLLIRIIKIAINVKNSYGKSLVLGITTILGIQFIWHIFSNLGLFMYAGAPLPFVSYSGTTIVINMCIVGIIINVYKGRSISNVELINDFPYRCIITITKR